MNLYVIMKTYKNGKKFYKAKCYCQVSIVEISMPNGATEFNSYEELIYRIKELEDKENPKTEIIFTGCIENIPEEEPIIGRT